ncbi:hypothetical protein D9M69_587320 [compost metagenome]
MVSPKDSRGEPWIGTRTCITMTLSAGKSKWPVTWFSSGRRRATWTGGGVGCQRHQSLSRTLPPSFCRVVLSEGWPLCCITKPASSGVT